MEIEGFKEAMDFLKEHNLLIKLKFIIADKDGKIARYVRTKDELKHIKILNDPGHWMKEIANGVDSILGVGKEFKGFVARIKQWFMYCVKEAEATIRKKLNIQEKRSLKLIEVYFHIIYQ